MKVVHIVWIKNPRGHEEYIDSIYEEADKAEQRVLEYNKAQEGNSHPFLAQSYAYYDSFPVK